MVETGDDTPHLIEHVGEVPINHVRQKGKLMNILHVSTITKNLVSVGPKSNGGKAQICEACQLGKQHRLPFPNERNRNQNKLDLMHVDV